MAASFCSLLRTRKLHSAGRLASRQPSCAAVSPCSPMSVASLRVAALLPQVATSLEYVRPCRVVADRGSCEAHSPSNVKVHRPCCPCCTDLCVGARLRGSSSSGLVISPESGSPGVRICGFSPTLFYGQLSLPGLLRSPISHGGAGLIVGAVQSRSFAAKTKKGNDHPGVSVEDALEVAREASVKLMNNALDVLAKEHSKLRTGRASEGMLDHITVEIDGVRNPLSHHAAVSLSGPQSLNVMPYDFTTLKEIEKAISKSPLGFNPQVDGDTIEIPLPRHTMVQCSTIIKIADKAGEDAKMTVRRARKEALDAAKDAGLSKDELKRFEREIAELTRKYNKMIDDTCKKKGKEIMS